MDSDRKQPPRRRGYREQSQRDAYDDFDYDDYDYEPAYEKPRRKRPLPRRPPKKRRTWPVLLMGCGLGVLLTVLGAAAVVLFTIHSTQGGSIPTLPIINNSRTFTRQEKQTLPALNSLTQLQVCDKVGNVSVKVDSTIPAPMLTVDKTVQANSQSAADQAFQSLTIQIAPTQTITNLSCSKSPLTPTAQTGSNSFLTVNVTFPATGNLVRANNDAVNLSLVLPSTSIQSDGPQLAVNIEAPVGNIAVDGLSGILNITGGTGNVSVSHAALADTSQIDTGEGNVTFNGLLLLPGNTNASAHYFIRSEQGTLDVTLPSNTNTTLDANTNVGSISSDFPITIKPNSDGSASYRGPLTPSATPSTSVVLVVDVSTGNIKIHQLQSSS